MLYEVITLQAEWLGLTAFFTLAIMLSLLVFIFEAVSRELDDPGRRLKPIRITSYNVCYTKLLRFRPRR